MKYDITNKTILITGSNRGIGRTLVNSFIEHGAAKVYAAVRTLESASPLVEKHGDKVAPIHIDLTDPKSISLAAETAKDVQVVVNNAGALKPSTPFADEAIESLKFEMEVNVYGLIWMAQAFAPVLKTNGGGVLVQVNSILAIKSIPNLATYSASKAASYSITQALVELLREQETLVLSVHPGAIATDMADEAGFTEIAEPPSIVAEEIIKAMKNGDFHVFPGMAKQIGGAYMSFAENVVEANLKI